MVSNPISQRSSLASSQFTGQKETNNSYEIDATCTYIYSSQPIEYNIVLIRWSNKSDLNTFFQINRTKYNSYFNFGYTKIKIYIIIYN